MFLQHSRLLVAAGVACALTVIDPMTASASSSFGVAFDVSPALPHAGAPFQVIFGGEWAFTKLASPASVRVEGDTIQFVQAAYGPPPILPPSESFAITGTVGPLAAGTYRVQLLADLPEQPDAEPFLICEETIEIVPPASITVSLPVAGSFYTNDAPTPVEIVAEVWGNCDRLGEVEKTGERRLAISVVSAPCSPPLHDLYTLRRETTLGLDTPGRWTLELRDARGVVLTRTAFEVLPFPVALRDGRFVVSVEWTEAALVAPALPASEPSDDSALFWFFDPSNWELMVKVLDGCGLNGHYWVFGAAQTDRAYRITIRDTLTDTTWTTENAAGSPAPATTDTTAFATCP